METNNKNGKNEKNEVEDANQDFEPSRSAANKTEEHENEESNGNDSQTPKKHRHFVKVCYKDDNDKFKESIVPMDDMYDSNIGYKENMNNFAGMIYEDGFVWVNYHEIIPCSRLTSISCFDPRRNRFNNQNINNNSQNYQKNNNSDYNSRTPFDREEGVARGVNNRRIFRNTRPFNRNEKDGARTTTTAAPSVNDFVDTMDEDENFGNR